MTLVGYFNSMRELGGMRRVVDDTLRTRLRQMDERGLANRYIYPFNVEELTSRKRRDRYPQDPGPLGSDPVHVPTVASARRYFG